MILNISSLEPYWVRPYRPDLVSEIVDMLGEQVALRRTHEHHLHTVLVHGQSASLRTSPASLPPDSLSCTRSLPDDSQ